MEKGPNYGGILGNDRVIEKDRILIVNNIALDTWIGAHYDIDLHSIPKGRNTIIPKDIIKRMKKTYTEELEQFETKEMK